LKNSPAVSHDFQTSEPPAGSAFRPRLESVDLLRGLVMVLMALDHTRDFFSHAGFSPTDLARTTPALFLTRWLTHFCAPVFVLLAGTGAFLSTARGRTIRKLSRFLFTRGIWLVFLELTYVNWFGWGFRVNLRAYGVQVIWALGCSMIALAGLVWLPRRAIAAFGLALIALHNAFDFVKPESLGRFANAWHVLHVPGALNMPSTFRFFVGYPLIPWMGVMAVGYAFGPVLLRAAPQRRKFLLLSGAALTALFIAIRAANVYGDPNAWAPQKNLLFSVFSFLNCQKYPPSLCYLLMTLGPALLALEAFDHGTPKPFKFLLAFGRVPLFFYLLHLPLVHGLALAANAIAANPSPAAPGFGLAAVYLFWISIVALLFPVCRWLAEFKRTHRGAWLSYL
jgi:uncharacterized membrane protein